MIDIRNTAQGILTNQDPKQRQVLTHEVLTQLNQNDQQFESAIKALQSAAAPVTPGSPYVIITRSGTPY